MKRISLLLLISVILNACTSVTPAPAETALIVSTSAHKESPTPEMTATLSLTPTPEGPVEGQTRFKEGVGEQVYQVIRNKEGNVLYEGWVRVKTPGDGIPILDWGISEYLGYSKSGNILLVCSDRYEACVDVPKITHIDKLPENNNDIDVTSATTNPMAVRFYNGNPPQGGAAITPILMDHPKGFDIGFFLDDPEHTMVWKIRPGSEPSAVTILTDWNDPLLEGGQELEISTSLTLRTRIHGVDENSRLIGVVALNNLPPEGAEHDSWRASVWSGVIYLPSSMVIQTDDVTSLTSEDVDLIRNIMYRAGKPSSAGNPWMIIEQDN